MSRAGVPISLHEVPEITERIVSLITEKQEKLEGKEIDFKQSMQFSKENFILLRLAKKIKKESERTIEKKTDTAFIVEMDKEEYKLFFSMIRMPEK